MFLLWGDAGRVAGGRRCVGGAREMVPGLRVPPEQTPQEDG